MKLSIGFIWLMFFSITLFSSCAKKQNDHLFDNAPQVKIASLSSMEISEEIKGFGSLSFIKKVDISSPSDAVLQRLLFREGDLVKEGDVVAVLANPQITLSVQRAESSYSHALAARDLALARLKEGEFMAEARLMENEKAETELNMARNVLCEQERKHESEEALYLAGAISDESIRDSRFRLESAVVQLGLMEKELDIRRIGFRNLDLANAGIPVPGDEQQLRQALIYLATTGLRAEAKAAAANLEAAGRELESCRFLESSLVIRSPMTGTVGARYFEEGERLTREEKIFTLMDTQSLFAVFPLPEAEALKLEKGMPALITLDGTGGTYNGMVDLVYPQADIQSFTFLVRVILPADSEGLLKPGMFARITIMPEQSRIANMIPENSLADKKDDQGRVFIIRNNVLSERIVQLGRLYGEEREIISGLNPGEVVVLLPDTSFRDGTYVSVEN